MVAIRDLVRGGFGRIRRALALAALVAVGSGAVLVASPAAALGGQLVASSPTSGAVLTSPPASVVLTFSAAPDVLSALTITGPSGQVSPGAPTISGTSMAKSLPPSLPNGVYTVSYSAHFGLFGGTAVGNGAFTVAVPAVTTPAPTTKSPAPATTTSSSSTTPRTSTSRTSRTQRITTPAPTPAPVSVTRTKTVTDTSTVTATPTTEPTPTTSSSPAPETSSSSSASTSVLSAPGPERTQPASETTSSSGLPSPPPLVWIALTLALAGFAANRFWDARRTRRARVTVSPPDVGLPPNAYEPWKPQR